MPKELMKQIGQFLRKTLFYKSRLNPNSPLSSLKVSQKTDGGAEKREILSMHDLFPLVGK